jgi:dihydroorotase-like cyclic amidohydrolase
MIDIVVSDHSPSTPELKRLDTGDFGAAWGGRTRTSVSSRRTRRASSTRCGCSTATR